MTGKKGVNASSPSSFSRSFLLICTLLACSSIYHQQGAFIDPLQYLCQNNNNDGNNIQQGGGKRWMDDSSSAVYMPSLLETNRVNDSNITSPRLHVVDPLFQAEYDRIDNEDPTIKCARYGLEYIPGTQPRRLFFGSLIASESWDMIMIQAVETHGIYHTMALVESNTTFLGTDRTLQYGPQSQKYQNLVHGNLFGPNTSVFIDYFVERAPDAILMVRESIQRDLILKRWIQQGMTERDVGIVSDIDETWSRDFLRVAQICQIPQFDPSDASCKTPKVVAKSIQFESSPECIKKKPWYHPDMVIGHCIEGIGDDSERTKPLRIYRRKRGDRMQNWGRTGRNDYPAHVLQFGRYPLYTAQDVRVVHGDNGRPIHFKNLTGDGKTHAWGTAFHFHNWFSNFSQLRHKYATYGHIVSRISQRTLSDIASDDLDIVVRCVRGLSNLANPRKDRKEYYIGGYDAVGGPKPIYFQNATYRRERHELLKRQVIKDEAQFGSWYSSDGTFVGKLIK